PAGGAAWGGGRGAAGGIPRAPATHVRGTPRAGRAGCSRRPAGTRERLSQTRPPRLSDPAPAGGGRSAAVRAGPGATEILQLAVDGADDRARCEEARSARGRAGRLAGAARLRAEGRLREDGGGLYEARRGCAEH